MGLEQSHQATFDVDIHFLRQAMQNGLPSCCSTTIAHCLHTGLWQSSTQGRLQKLTMQPQKSEFSAAAGLVLTHTGSRGDWLEAEAHRKEISLARSRTRSRHRARRVQREKEEFFAGKLPSRGFARPAPLAPAREVNPLPEGRSSLPWTPTRRPGQS